MTNADVASQMNYNNMLIASMLRMQKELDEKIFENSTLNLVGGEKRPSESQYFYAIFDELGEFNHELKKDWCWWKKTQPEVNREKALEELVDIWHFVLSWTAETTDLDLFIKGYLKICPDVTDMPSNIKMYWQIVSDLYSIHCHWTPVFSMAFPNKLLEDMVLLSWTNGFNLDEVYSAYVEKNMKNLRRTESGY